MKIKNRLKTIGLFSVLILTMIMSGCSFNGGRSVKQYVDTVKDDMRSAVNITRELKKANETLDCRNKESAKEYIVSLQQLEDKYAELSCLDAPERYIDLDNDLKTWCETALSSVSKIKMLVTTAMNTSDDKLFRQNQEGIMIEYDKAVNELVDISSQITTRYRND